ncbi:hypothetical protein BS78_05G072100 [Paspalum vaginatum]|uniref:Uncharacterized protein n=1 Tax=Paspalum vaginatum TaxID=158149 RepID=A0A9W8CE82_9POAL|nr:hypothetical protein BS78_K040000 [Paspalum vaginatum]KAJ1274574.1 hypothetical protein BS78_05G072100 [Paspalum vaginatum]
MAGLRALVKSRYVCVHDYRCKCGFKLFYGPCKRMQIYCNSCEGFLVSKVDPCSRRSQGRRAGSIKQGSGKTVPVGDPLNG